MPFIVSMRVGYPLLPYWDYLYSAMMPGTRSGGACLVTVSGCKDTHIFRYKGKKVTQGADTWGPRSGLIGMLRRDYMGAAQRPYRGLRRGIDRGPRSGLIGAEERKI